ncbi:hydrolase [Sphingomonas sp. MMS24-J13]|uniref:hydrolase n=1 Tax=Sphingomonas sp. MMS24-J13 TaxID=3238686 RepID=UPI00384C6301
MILRDADRVIIEALDGHAMIARAIDWCAINSGSRNLAGLEEMAAPIEAALGDLPGAVERIPLPDTTEVATDGTIRTVANAPALRLRVRPDAPVRIALTGHYDTVYPAETRFRTVVTRADGALHGPGIADMKGGISVMLAALAAFERHPAAANLGYTVLLSPDEETGSLASAPLLAELGALAHIGMTYEPALADGTLASGRKGSGNFHIRITGRAAHAGRDFASGRNAILAAARIAQALGALNGQRDGLTVNVARIDGGAPLNMVPDIAVLRFNARLPRIEDEAWLMAGIDEAMHEGIDDGIAAELHGGITRKPKPFVPAQQALFEHVRAAGALLGQTIGWGPSGGVCEGNNLFAAGLPGVDTLGVRGGDIHSEREFAWPESFGQRAQLSALLLAKLADGTIDGPGLRAALSRHSREGGNP